MTALRATECNYPQLDKRSHLPLFNGKSLTLLPSLAFFFSFKMFYSLFNNILKHKMCVLSGENKSLNVNCPQE